MRRFIVLVVLALLGLPAAGASAATLGEQRVLMMLTTWGPEPYAPATIRAELDEAAAYIRSVSFGTTWIAGEVTPWLHALASKPGCDTAAIAQAARSAERRGRLFVRWRRGLERGSGLVAHEVFVDGRRTGRVPTVRTVASIAVATDDSLVVRVSRGRHRLRVVAIDRAGNRSRPVSRIVRP